MPSLFDHQIHQNNIYTSNGRYSIHKNKNYCIGLKTFFAVWSGVVTIDEVPHAQQTSDVRDGHHADMVPIAASIYLLHKLRWVVL